MCALCCWNGGGALWLLLNAALAVSVCAARMGVYVCVLIKLLEESAGACLRRRCGRERGRAAIAYLC